MRINQSFAVLSLTAAATLAWAPAAVGEVFQVERDFSCQANACFIGDLPAVPKAKILTLRNISCELYVAKQNINVNRAVFYIYGKRGNDVTPRHRFIVGYFYDGVSNGISEYTAGLSENFALELKAGYSLNIEAKSIWNNASGACTVVGDLTKK